MKTLKKNSVEQTIVEMLTENTGRHMLDSGGAYGRNWQRNAKKTIKTFEKEPQVSWDEDYGWTISLYHFLTRDLELDDVCHEFNSECVPAADWDSEIYGVSAAGESWLKAHGLKERDTFNSYNGDSALSQVIQGTWLTDEEDESYLLLQIHGGCDVRGGYTDARLFKVPGYEDGAFFEDVYGTVTKKDGTVIEIDNCYDRVNLTANGDGTEVNIEKGDKVELWLMEY